MPTYTKNQLTLLCTLNYTDTTGGRLRAYLHPSYLILDPAADCYKKTTATGGKYFEIDDRIRYPRIKIGRASCRERVYVLV